MWHTLAALVPLPLIGFGYLPPFRAIRPLPLELYLSRQRFGARPEQDRRRVSASQSRAERPPPLFGTRRQGTACRPLSRRRGRHLRRQAPRSPQVSSADRALPRTSATRGEVQAANARPIACIDHHPSDVALQCAPTPATRALMNASYGSMFGPSFDVDSFRPSPEEIAYSPTPRCLELPLSRARRRPNSRSASAAASPPPFISRRAASRCAARSPSAR